MKKRCTACVALQTFGSICPFSRSAYTVSMSWPSAVSAATRRSGRFSSSLIFTV